ncbi:MAG: hypothetical protein ACNA8J_02465 [Gammaproteobacteria bacterium]
MWQILLRRHPVRLENPSGSCGFINRNILAEVCEAICDYPDYLQDTLLVIAHAEGFEAAMAALDDAVREYLAARLGRLPVSMARPGDCGNPSD